MKILVTSLAALLPARALQTVGDEVLQSEQNQLRVLSLALQSESCQLGPTFQAGKWWNLSFWFIFAFTKFMHMCYVHICAYTSTCLCTHMCGRMQMEVHSSCQQLTSITRPPCSSKQILTIKPRALQCGQSLQLACSGESNLYLLSPEVQEGCHPHLAFT